MGPLVLHLRAEARRRRLAWLAVVALIGVVGGLAMGAAAGARRTATAFDRFVGASEAADVMVNPNLGSFSALDVDDVATLPGVRQIGVIEGGGGIIVTKDGDYDTGTQVFVQRGSGALIDFERPRVVDGRMVDPSDPTEVVLTDDVAERLGIDVGGTLTFGTMTMEELEAWEQDGEQGEPPLTFVDMTVVGTIVSLDGVVTDEVYQYGQAILSDAFREQHEPASYYYGVMVDLEGGSEAVPAFRRAVGALVPDEAFEFQTLEAKADVVRRGARPHVIALVAFAGLVGAAGAVVCGQAVVRQLAPLRSDAAALAALGVGRRNLRVGGALRSACLAVPGAFVAGAIAILVSPVFPVGVSRRAEVSGGFAVDWVVIGPGVAGIVVAMILLGWVTTRSSSNLPIGAGSSASTSRPAGVLDRLARASNRPVLTTGVRAAIGGNAGTGSASSGSGAAVAGLAVAIGAVVASLTFGAGLLALVGNPSAYGWPWDIVVAPPGDDDHVDTIRDRVDESTAIAGSSELVADQLMIGDHRIPAVGVATPVEEGAGLTIVAGRQPMAADEIALGGRTMRQLGTAIGHQIEVGSAPDARLMTVVGQAVFPGIGTYSGADRTELGKGALLDSETLTSAGEGFDALFFAMSVEDGAKAAAVADLVEGFDAAVAEGELEVIELPQRPGDVRSLESVRRTPEAIAGMLALLAGAAVSFVLIAGVRGRRRELALLRTFGFSRRDVAASLLWQSSTTAALALLVGVPLGVVAGRLAWTALAESIGVVAEPRIPLSILAVVAAVVVLANLAAVVPGAMAARIRPSVALRAE